MTRPKPAANPVVVLELRCRFCEGDLFAGSRADGWRCLRCGSDAVVLAPPSVCTHTPAGPRVRVRA